LKEKCNKLIDKILAMLYIIVRLKKLQLLKEV